MEFVEEFWASVVFGHKPAHKVENWKIEWLHDQGVSILNPKEPQYLHGTYLGPKVPAWKYLKVPSISHADASSPQEAIS